MAHDQPDLPPLTNDPGPRVGPGEKAGLGERVFAQWAESSMTLGAHVEALRMWTRDVVAAAPRSRLDWCVASLEEIRESLEQLSAVLGEASVLIHAGSPLVRYVTGSYVWTGDVMLDVLALVQELRGGDSSGAMQAQRSTDEESEYVREVLDPLYAEIMDLRPEVDGDPHLREALPLVASLRATILTLDWALQRVSENQVDPSGGEPISRGSGSPR